MGWFDKWGSSVLGFAGDLVGGLLGSHSASEANRANVNMSREQREWEEQMSNTAVTRRKQDFINAGFNPVLAATGTGASTPSVSAPTVEPTFDPSWTKGSSAAAVMQRAQLDNIRADTAAKEAEARNKKVGADLAEKTYNSELEYRVKRNVERFDQEALRTGIMRGQQTSSAAQAKQLEQTVDAVVAKAKQQAELGQLDLESAKRIAAEFGLSTSATSQFLRLIVDFLNVTKR